MTIHCFWSNTRVPSKKKRIRREFFSDGARIPSAKKKSTTCTLDKKSKRKKDEQALTADADVDADDRFFLARDPIFSFPDHICASTESSCTNSSVDLEQKRRSTRYVSGSATGDSCLFCSFSLFPLFSSCRWRRTFFSFFSFHHLFFVPRKKLHLFISVALCDTHRAALWDLHAVFFALMDSERSKSSRMHPKFAVEKKIKEMLFVSPPLVARAVLLKKRNKQKNPTSSSTTKTTNKRQHRKILSLPDF